MPVIQTREELAESVAIRIHDALAIGDKPVGRDYDHAAIADLAAVLYGDDDDDVKALRGIKGPVALSIAYMEISTGDFLLLLPDSRRYDADGPPDGYAFYTGAILDNPGDLSTARCVNVHTNYLANGCERLKLNDVPLATQAALLGILARKDEPGTWDKHYVDGVKVD